jgi:hypothetical protein
MQEISFGREWNQRAGFVAAIAVIYPVILTAYVMFYYKGNGLIEFWLVGMGLTLLVCLVVGSYMLIVILIDRRRRAEKRRRLRMWEKVLPYDAAKARARKADEVQS